MTNKERQAQLDKIKYEESIIAQRDLSGKMFYCDMCDKTDSNFNCLVAQEERESGCLCAKAYNKGKRKK